MCDCNYENCGCNDECVPCAPVNCIEQAVNDALAQKKETLEGYVDDAKESAETASQAASDASGFRDEAKGFRDQAEVAANTATEAVPAITEAVVTIQETADAVKKMGENLEEQIKNYLDDVSFLPWVYNNGSANGGETSVVISVDGGTALGVASVYVNGNRQHEDLGYTFDSATQTLTLADALEQGDELIAFVSTEVASPDATDINNYRHVAWLYNNGSANGGETTLTPPYTFKLVPAIYHNGARKVVGLHYQPQSNNTITLKFTVAQGDIIQVILGGTPDEFYAQADSIFTTLASDAGAGLIGTASGLDLQKELDKKVYVGQYFLTPEQFGAVGDGVTDDTVAVVDCWEAAKAKASNTVHVIVLMQQSYSITGVTLIGSSNTTYTGGGTIVTPSDALDYTMVTFDDCTHFTLNNIKITRTAFSDPSVMWSKTNQGVVITNCSYFSVTNCEATYHTDGISVSSGSYYIVHGNRTYELGEEGIALRRSQHFVCSNNFVFHHHGDGILLKTANVACLDGLIEGNHVFDGYQKAGIAGGARGGGITLNDEVIGTVSGINFSSLTVTNNHIRNTSYGLSFANVDDLRIENNSCIDIDRFGINWDTTVFNNPSLNPMYRGAVVGNTVRNCGQIGISATPLNGISIFNILIGSNVIEAVGTQTTAEYPAIASTGGVVTGNIVINTTVAYQGTDSVATGNRFIGSTRTSDGVSAVWLKVGGSGIFSNNLVVDSNKGYIRINSGNSLTFSDNYVNLQSAFAGLYFTGSFTTGLKASGNNYSVPNYPSVSNFNVGPTSIRSMQLSIEEFGRRTHVYDGVAATGITYLTGDIVSSRAPNVGSPRDYIVASVNTDGTPVLAPLNYNRRLVTTQASLTIVNGTFAKVVVTGLTGVISNWVAEGVSTGGSAQGLTITAHVTQPQEVTFLIWNHSGFDRTLTDMTLSVYVHALN